MTIFLVLGITGSVVFLASMTYLGWKEMKDAPEDNDDWKNERL
jgi:hypothetical protein